MARATRPLSIISGSAWRLALLCASFGWTWSVLSHSTERGLWLSLALLLPLAIPALLVGPKLEIEGRPAGIPDLIAGLMLLALGIVFRLVHLDQVPIAFNSEGFNFITFASNQARNGFSYIPYSWYAHTLYSYIMALAMLFVSPDVWAARVASAGISVITLLMVFVAARSLFGTRTAWLTLGTVSISFWHIWASRNGYHQFLMPLVQALFLLTLSEAAKRQSSAWFIASGLTIGLALHAYWGLYLLPFVGALFLCWLALTQGKTCLKLLRPFVYGVAAAVISSAPVLMYMLIQTNVFGYPASRLRGAEYAKNFERIAWSLSGNSQAQFKADYAPILDMPIASCFVIGLAIALTRLRRDRGAALTICLFAVYFAGLTATDSTLFFMMGLFLSVHLLAGLGLGALVSACEALLGWVGRSAACVLLLAALLLQGKVNYALFFESKTYSMGMQTPTYPNGLAASIMSRLEKDLGEYNVVLHHNRPNFDFGQFYDTLLNYRGYDYLRQIGYIDDGSAILTPKFTPKGGRDAVMYLVHRPPIEGLVLKTFEMLYPSLTQEPIYSPEPYHKEQIATRVVIPWNELQRYHGLAAENTGSEYASRGMIFVERDGSFQLRVAGSDSSLSIELHGRALPLQKSGGEILSERFLAERGFHPITLKGPHPFDCSALSLVGEHDKGQAACPLLANSAGLSEQQIAPFFGRIGKPTDFTYLRNKIYVAYNRQVLYSALRLPETRQVLGLTSIMLVLSDENGNIVRAANVRSYSPLKLARLGGGAVFISGFGRVYKIDPESLQLTLLADLRAQATMASEIAGRVALAGPGLWWTGVDRQGRSELLPIPPHRQRSVSSVASSSAGLELLDTFAGEWITMDHAGNELAVKKVPHVYHGVSEVASDSYGNVLVSVWNRPLKAYAPDGLLLFHPEISRPLPFAADRYTEGFWNNQDMKFYGDLASAVRDDQVFLYDRISPLP